MRRPTARELWPAQSCVATALVSLVRRLSEDKTAVGTALTVFDKRLVTVEGEVSDIKKTMTALTD